MLRFFFGLLLLSSCSLGVIKSGGDKAYVYDASKEYTSEELKELAPSVITTQQRDPYKGKLDVLFSKNQKPIKRIGILVFETEIQPTRSGLSGEDKIYLSAAGKQLMTERLLTIWEQSFGVLSSDVEYVPVSVVKGSKSYMDDGFSVKDQVMSERHTLAPDDIFFLEKGKITTTQTILNARGMRDLSLALVPASELMAGPKFSEHAKHTLNATAKELNLDAMLVIMSELRWGAAHIDKHSGESIAEDAVIKLKATTVVPLSSYRERMEKSGQTRDIPNQTVSYRYYESKINLPIQISVPEASQTFDYIEANLLNPVIKTYNDLAHMMQMRIIEDIKKTHP